MATRAARYALPFFGDDDGRLIVIPGASILIREAGTVGAASLWADRAKATPLANPLPTGVVRGAAGLDIDGNAVFYADPGDDVDGSTVYEAVVTVGNSTVGPVSIGGAPPDMADVQPPIPSGTYAEREAAGSPRTGRVKRDQLAPARINLRDYMEKPDGSTDNTTAMNLFLADCSPITTTRPDKAGGYMPPGWYRFDQLVCPSGADILGGGWGFMGTIWGSEGGSAVQYQKNLTLLQQLEGAEKDAWIFSEPPYVDPVSGKRWIGPLSIRNFVLQGHRNNTLGSGMVFRDAVGNMTIEDQVFLSHLFFGGFAVDGLVINGALPLNVEKMSFFMNGRDGLHYTDSNTQGIHISGISGDSQGRALIHIENVPSTGSVVISGVKSEQINNRYKGDVAGFQAAVLITNCKNAPIHVEGVTHICAQPDPGDPSVYLAPTAAIVVDGSGPAEIPRLTWNAVAARVRLTDTHQDEAGVLRDDAGTGTLLPVTNTAGSYGYNWTRTHSDAEAGRWVLGGTTYKGPTPLWPAVEAQGLTPGFSWYETDGGADAKSWVAVASGERWSLRTYNDAGDTFEKALEFVRSAAAATIAQLRTARLELGDDAAGETQLRFNALDQGSTLAIQHGSAGAPTLIFNPSGTITWSDGANLIIGTTTGIKIGTAANQKIGKWGATPVVQPSGTPAAATDLATAISLVNDLRAKLLATGEIGA